MECLAKDEVDTMANLGAGMVPRACHIPGIDKVRCFEVNHPEVVKRNRETVSAQLACDANDAVLRFVGKVPRGSKLAF